MVHIEKTLLLNAEIGEELGIATQILRVLLRDLPCRHIRRFSGSALWQLLLLLAVLDRVSVEQTTLVDEHVHVVEHCVPQHVPVQGRQDLTLLRYNRLIGVRVASR